MATDNAGEWQILSQRVSTVKLPFIWNIFLRNSYLQITVNMGRNTVLIKQLLFTPLYGKSFHYNYHVLVNRLKKLKQLACKFGMVQFQAHFY